MAASSEPPRMVSAVWRAVYHRLTVSQGPGYVGSSAELDTEQQVNRVLDVYKRQAIDRDVCVFHYGKCVWKC